MHQPSLLDDLENKPPTAVVGIPGSTRGLSRAQRKFNQLVQRLRQQRDELVAWQAYRHRHAAHIAGVYEPALARLRAGQLAMVRLLDRNLDGRALRGRERTTARVMLEDLIEVLLAESDDPEIVRIHDKYAQQTYGEVQQDQLEFLRTLASTEYGIDVGAYAGRESPDEFAAWFEAQSAARRDDAPPARARKKSARTRTAEAPREPAASGATYALRDVFRKLVSELHPDRETDPAEQARKTALMQRVNQAYAAGDLLGLLELQLGIEQIDPDALAGLAEDRLDAYLQVLEDQSRRLQAEVAANVAPFASALRSASSRNPTPASVQRALERDIRAIDALARQLGEDVELFENVEALKRELRAYDEACDADLYGAPDFTDSDFTATPAAAARRPGKSRRRRR